MCTARCVDRGLWRIGLWSPVCHRWSRDTEPLHLPLERVEGDPMSRAWIRHGLLGCAVVLGAAGAVGSLSTGDLPGHGDSWGLAVSFVGFALLGWAVGGRRPELPIGWLFLVGGTLGVAAFLASWWSFQSLIRDPGSVPGGPVAAWLAVWLSPLPWPLVLVAPLVLFPTGRVRTRRWFWFMIVIGATIGTLVIVAAAVSLPVAARHAVELIDAPGHAATGTAGFAIGLAAIARLVAFVATLIAFRRPRRRSPSGQRSRPTAVHNGHGRCRCRGRE